jgi:hypothetical protein
VDTLTLKYNASLKFSGAHDAPWLTVESDSEEELNAALSSLGEGGSDTFPAIGRAIAAFRRDALLGEVLGAHAIPQQQPAQAGPPAWTAPPANGFTAPPAAPVAGEAKYCQHGMRTLVTGTGKNGLPFLRYDCPNRECAAEWGKNR